MIKCVKLKCIESGSKCQRCHSNNDWHKWFQGVVIYENYGSLYVSPPKKNQGTHLYFEFICSFISPLYVHKQITAIKCAAVPLACFVYSIQNGSIIFIYLSDFDFSNFFFVAFDLYFTDWSLSSDIRRIIYYLLDAQICPFNPLSDALRRLFFGFMFIK